MPLVPPAARKPYTVEEVAKHNTAASLWVIMNRKALVALVTFATFVAFNGSFSCHEPRRVRSTTSPRFTRNTRAARACFYRWAARTGP